MSRQNTKSLAPNVAEALREVRSMLRRYIAIQSLLSIACIVLFFFWAGGCLDYLPVTMGASETPRWLRVGLLSSMVVGTGYVLFVWAAPRLMARIHDRSIALMLEKKHPHLENHLLTAVELTEEPEVSDFALVSNPEAYAKMLERVHAGLDDRTQRLDTASLFDWRPIWAGMLSVFLSLAITGFACLAMPDWMLHWSKRLFALSETPWPRRAELRIDGVQIQLPTFTGQLTADRRLLGFRNGVVRVAGGSTAQLQVAAEAETKVVPEICTVFYRQTDGTRGRANMRRLGRPEEGWQTFVLDGPPLDGISQTTDLRVIGLDASLIGMQLEVTPSPLVKSTKLELVYPEYLLSNLTRAASETVEFRNGLLIPEGTHVYLVGETGSILSSVDYVIQSSEQQAAELKIDQVPPSGEELSQFRIDLGPLRESKIVELRLIDQYGLSSEQVTRYLLSVQPDEIPLVESKLAGIGNAITTKALLPIRGSVQDDHGLKTVQVDMQASDESKFIVEVAPPEDMELSTDVDLQMLAEEQGFALKEGETLGLQVSASDFFDLDKDVHLGQGQTKQLNIVSDDELLVLLDRKELELRQRIEQIMLELEQLKSSLQQLSTKSNAARMSGRAAVGTVSWAAAQDTDDEEERRARMLVLRSQQAVLQGDKSQQELSGVAANVENLRQQLANNRIDSYDRQQRLREKVHSPLQDLLASEYERLASDLAALQKAAIAGRSTNEALAAESSAAEVLAKLAQIKENMLDIESFNEIIDLVRSLLEDQEKLLNETEEEQRKRILQFLQ
ncbi:MAG: hypothetical protein VXZ82_16845 [Planctomycetota bacterium]|nr:hypothetical protein [Planctomycetota bacterium]